MTRTEPGSGPVAPKPKEDYSMGVMQPLKAESPPTALTAVVRNGRLVVDEPTDLPEGLEVKLVVAEDEFEPEEKARLLQAIEEGIEDIERGDHMDGFEFIAQLRAKREAASR